MKTKTLVTIAAIALTGLAAPAWSQGSAVGGYGMGPGMMRGGYGMGPGVMGGGYGMGPGMMRGGYGMGPGMMRGGYGMGPGMMGGAGCAMGGWGMHHGAWPFASLDLSAEQRTQMRAIRRDLMHKHWQLMEQMQAQADALDEADAFDEQAERRAFDAGTAARKAMFEARMDAQKRMLAVLTADQRAKLRAMMR